MGRVEEEQQKLEFENAAMSFLQFALIPKSKM